MTTRKQPRCDFGNNLRDHSNVRSLICRHHCAGGDGAPSLVLMEPELEGDLSDPNQTKLWPARLALLEDTFAARPCPGPL